MRGCLCHACRDCPSSSSTIVVVLVSSCKPEALAVLSAFHLRVCFLRVFLSEVWLGSDLLEAGLPGLTNRIWRSCVDLLETEAEFMPLWTSAGLHSQDEGTSLLKEDDSLLRHTFFSILRHHHPKIAYKVLSCC